MKTELRMVKRIAAGLFGLVGIVLLAPSYIAYE
jgi:hypothetical protein